MKKDYPFDMRFSAWLKSTAPLTDESHLRKTVSRRIYRGPYSYEEHLDRSATNAIPDPAR